MTPFKFFKNNDSSFNERLRMLSQEVQEAYSRRTINRNYYTNVNMTQPVKEAVVDSINYCNRNNIRYEDNEHHFEITGSPFKLIVLEIRHYRNPVHTFYQIKYKMARWNVDFDVTVANTLRLEPEEYYRRIHPRP